MASALTPTAPGPWPNVSPEVRTAILAIVDDLDRSIVDGLANEIGAIVVAEIPGLVGAEAAVNRAAALSIQTFLHLVRNGDDIDTDAVDQLGSVIVQRANTRPGGTS